MKLFVIAFKLPKVPFDLILSKNDTTEVKDVTLACEAGGNCGSCHILIQLFIDQNSHKNLLARTPESEEANLKKNKKSFWKKLLSKP